MSILFLAGCKPNEAKRLDTDFEGKIVYKMFDWETRNVDSAKAAYLRNSFLKDSMICYFDEGSFLAVTSGALYEYQYFNPHTNRMYAKATGEDSLWVIKGDKPFSGKDALLDVKHELNTDTVLGYACNKLTLKFKNETRTYLYSPKIATNPEWYKKSTAMGYDVVYKQMKAYYLSMHCEFVDHTYTLRATSIIPGRVRADIFPKVEEMPQIPIN